MKLVNIACLTMAAASAVAERGKECASFCPMNYDPVCGSDGNTYPNVCALSVRNCLESTNTEVVHGGPCEDPEDIGISEVEGCPTVCNAVYMPVCGSNGVTYPNQCELSRARCGSESLFKFVSEGPCPIVDDDAAMPVDVELPIDVEPVVNSPCPEVCSQIWDPLCGSDGVTYSNKCLLDAASCHSATPITIVSNGECDQADASKPKPTMRLCMRHCSDSYEPMCGSDGVTYPNPCQLANAACHMQQDTLVLASPGPCPQAESDHSSEAESDHSSSGSELEPLNHGHGNKKHPLNGHSHGHGNEKHPLNGHSHGHGGATHHGAGRVHSCDFPCAKILQPVCGSDGVTYNNRCLLRVAACRALTHMAIAHHGPCEGDSDVMSDDVISDKSQEVEQDAGSTVAADSQGFSDLKSSDVIECPVACTSIYKPVCASNGVTYSSECELRRIECEHQRRLLFVDGECEEEDMTDDCQMMCADVYTPLCASNDVTYANVCELRRAECMLNLTLRFTDGECEAGAEADDAEGHNNKDGHASGQLYAAMVGGGALVLVLGAALLALRKYLASQGRAQDQPRPGKPSVRYQPLIDSAAKPL